MEVFYTYMLCFIGSLTLFLEESKPKKYLPREGPVSNDMIYGFSESKFTCCHVSLPKSLSINFVHNDLYFGCCKLLQVFCKYSMPVPPVLYI